MVLPVWMSHCDRPECETLVCALLDIQYDMTFILDETCDATGVHGTAVKLSLSMRSAKIQLVNSKRIKGLVVRGFNCDNTLHLPVAFSREIMPASRSHIPTPERANKWPHLRCLISQLKPLVNCEVGLLIGCNCSRAVVSRDVIHPRDGGLYVQKTDLDWGIVGIVDRNRVDNATIGSKPVKSNHHSKGIRQKVARGFSSTFREDNHTGNDRSNPNCEDGGT